MRKPTPVKDMNIISCIDTAFALLGNFKEDSISDASFTRLQEIVLKLNGYTQTRLNKQQAFKTFLHNFTPELKHLLMEMGNPSGSLTTYFSNSHTLMPALESVVKNTSSHDPSSSSLVLNTSSPADSPIDVLVSEKLLQLHKSAIKRGKEFNLTPSDVKSLLTRKTCYYTGVRFTASGIYSRTIDRIDNTKGYVKGNVCACTRQANYLKEHLFEGDHPVLRIEPVLLKKMLGKLC